MTGVASDELDELMVAAAGGDERAFQRFYDLSAPAILAFLMRMLRDRFLAEDVLQEAMVIAWNRSHEFDPGRAAAKTWITTIARRRALDVIRSRKRRQTVVDDDAPEIRRVFGHDGGATAESESGLTAKRLADCFGQLSEDAAACIQFAYLDGLTFREISERIDTSLSTVKSWIRRGLVKLQKCMQS